MHVTASVSKTAYPGPCRVHSCNDAQYAPQGNRQLRLARYGFVCLALLGAAFVTPASADGVAVFASLQDPASIESTRMRIATALGVTVKDSAITIEGTDWVRLHSATLVEGEARALVGRARESGFSAWYNGSGDSLASSSQATATRYVDEIGQAVGSAEMVNKRTISAEQSDGTGGDVYGEPNTRGLGIVRPARGDVSHLPMAETFPVD